MKKQLYRVTTNFGLCGTVAKNWHPEGSNIEDRTAPCQFLQILVIQISGGKKKEKPQGAAGGGGVSI